MGKANEADAEKIKASEADADKAKAEKIKASEADGDKAKAKFELKNTLIGRFIFLFFIIFFIFITHINLFYHTTSSIFILQHRRANTHHALQVLDSLFQGLYRYKRFFGFVPTLSNST